MWGVIETDDYIHVIPCDNEGDVLYSHVVEWWCGCRPELEEVVGGRKSLIVHNEIH